MQKFTFILLRVYFRTLSWLLPSVAVARAAKIFFTPRQHTPKPIENEIKAQAQRVELDNGVVYYVWGEGKPVIFIHGWEGRATQVSSLLPKLKDDFQVIAIDAPAHGESQGTISHPRLFIETLFSVVDKIGPVHGIIGHSMGGGSAAFAASQGIQASKIVNIAGPSNFLHVVSDYADFIGLSGRAKNQFLQHVSDVVKLPYTQLEPENFNGEPKPSLLVVHDELDREVPVRHAHAINDQADNVEVALSRGLGHRKILYAEQTVDRVHQFLLQ